MDRHTRLDLRLVSKSLKYFIDEFMGVYVVINEQRSCAEALKHFSKVVIRKAVVEEAHETNFHTYFKKPEYLDAIFIEGGVNATFLADLLSSCPKLMIIILLGKIVDVLPQRITDNSASFRKKIAHLRSIDIRISCSPLTSSLSYEMCRETCQNMINFLSIFHAPCLETCCLDSWITLPYDRTRTAEVLINFFEIHLNLKGILIFFRMHDKDFSRGRENVLKEPLAEPEMRLAGRLENLGKKLKLTTCIMSAVPYSNLWEYFLKGQTQLRTLSLCDKFCDWGPCERPMKQNWQSLRVLYILVELQRTLDFEIFAECENLRELILINTSMREIIPGMALDLAGLEKMNRCSHLHFCAFSNMIMDTSDLFHLTTQENLEVLALLSTGYGFGTGVDLELLQELLGKRELEALLIDGTVADSEEVAERLKEIISILAVGCCDEIGNIPQGLFVNITPPQERFYHWSPNPYGDGFLFNMEFNHHNP